MLVERFNVINSLPFTGRQPSTKLLLASHWVVRTPAYEKGTLPINWFAVYEFDAPNKTVKVLEKRWRRDGADDDFAHERKMLPILSAKQSNRVWLALLAIRYAKVY